MTTTAPTDTAPSSSPPPPPPSPSTLEAETAELVSAGYVGWQVCWSKRLSRRYWSKRPTRTEKEITRWEPPTSPHQPPRPSNPQPPPPEEEKKGSDAPPSPKRRKVDPSPPPHPLPSHLLAPAVTTFSDQSRFDAVLSLAHRVIALHVFSSPPTSSAPSYTTPLPSPPTPHYVEDHPLVILARRNHFLACDAALTSLTRAHTSLPSPPVNAFQRWGFSQRLLHPTSLDPLLPTDCDVDDALVAELVREKGVEEAKAKLVAGELAKEVRRRGQEMDRMREEYSGRPYTPGCIRVQGEGGGVRGQVRLQLMEGERVLYDIPLNQMHWEKLQRLYRTHTLNTPTVAASTASSSSPPSVASLSNDDVFLHRVFALLARYDTIAGAGYQVRSSTPLPLSTSLSSPSPVPPLSLSPPLLSLTVLRVSGGYA